MTAPAVKKPRHQVVLSVLETSWVSPHLIRVVVGGDAYDELNANESTDRYVKLLFARPELGLVPPYNLEELAARLPAEDQPVKRTYTVRWMDPVRRRLAIDFVVHGDEGVAGPWAARALPGDALVLMGPSGAWSPRPDADWYLFAGDEAALPAIAAGLEALPEAAVGTAWLEVDSEADTFPLTAPAGMEIRWLFRRGRPAGTTSLLADAVASAEWPAGSVEAFVHGERGAMKALRDVLFTQRGLERGQVSLSGYWAYGRAEDRFQAEKREPIGRILD